jgi:catechol 2,3-dioxygenase-like lactoylglutathione lyase family enzyme
VAVCGIDHVQLAMPGGGEQLAREFYGGVLGLIEVPKPPNLVARGGCWFQCGPLQLHLGVEADFCPAKKAHPALLVTNLAELLEALSSAGFEVRHDSEPVQGRDRAFTADPFGNRIELIAADEKSLP